MKDFNELEKRISLIEARNARVELDKAREANLSHTRIPTAKSFICSLRDQERCFSERDGSV